MDNKKIEIPYLSDEFIENKARFFRKKFWNNTLPVDIETIIDLKLKMDIVPTESLASLCDSDALITSNWRSIYVDKDKFEDDRYQNRLRFSFAHEMGHFVLHKYIYSSFQIREIEDFYKFIEEITGSQYGYFETQANKFANYLLVPREKLIIERQRELQRVGKSPDFKIIKDSKLLNDYMAGPLAPIFGVSQEVIQIALNDIERYKNLKP